VDWAPFASLVHGVQRVESGLQYVSVSQGGVTLFHEQARVLDDPAAAPSAPAAGAVDPRAARVGRKLLSVGRETVPVVTFTVDVKAPDGSARAVEVALRKDTVERRESLPLGAAVSMFRVSLLTVLVAFALCLAVVVWMMRRESLRARQRRAEEHMAFAGVMAGGIVHDFRNPMSSLRLDLQMLQKEVRREEALRRDRLEQLVDRATGTMDRMDKVFQEFLLLARGTSGKREPVDLGGVVRECLELLRPRFDHKRLQVRVEAPEPGLRVLADGASLRRALVNVLTNAEQFSPDDGTVVVRLARAGHHAAMDILDSGPGFSGEARRRAFELFYSTRPGGTGLGLFLTKMAVERLDGAIRIKDRAEGGAWLRIELPLAKGVR
jgi:two-component system, NtrC family, sensor histidine kinase HydH